MNLEERKAYMKRLADNARAEYRAMEMERAALTAQAIRASVEASKGQKPMTVEEFLERMDNSD